MVIEALRTRGCYLQLPPPMEARGP